MRVVDTYEGRGSAEGWLELDVKSVDIEGAGKIFIDLDEVEGLKARRSQESDALQQAKRLLGG